MQPLRAVSIFFVSSLLVPSLVFAAQADRITAPLSGGPVVAMRGNLHGLARPEFDLGRVSGSQPMSGMSLSFRLSPIQQADLEQLLKDQQDRTSPHYHQWLTPTQFADRFGLSRNDVQKVTSWLEEQGFTITSVANSRNQIFFEGTAAQVEAAFRTEIHSYVVNGELHYANVSEPSLPANLAGIVLGVNSLHNFQPKPPARATPHLTSYQTGSHFLTPDDFGTIYDVNGLYSGGFDGTGQTIAIVGQSEVSLSDIQNFRKAAGLSTNNPTLQLVPNTTGSFCRDGDEFESDLDIEWSGGVAKNASIIFVYAGLGTGDTCKNRAVNVWNALQYAVDNKVASIISTSYGFCESGLGSSFASTVRSWAQQANSQGQTIVASTGDSGAADCDTGTSATHGLQVDIPASIPEVTGAGGTRFNGTAPSGDPAGTLTGTAPNTNADATQYWSGTSNSTDTISSALSYIPEIAWNDTADPNNNGQLSASGGGKSTFFSKPSWQSGTGVPNDGQRDVPDIALSASPLHDSYLVCSEDNRQGATQPSCVSGFRNSTGDPAYFTAVGGTSAAAPTFSGLLALFNDYFGNTSPSGVGNANPSLYQFATSGGFNDITSGNNIVPCTPATTGCPTSAPFEYGFSAGAGYDQVTGLGSVNAFTLAQAWGATLPSFSASAASGSAPVVAGHSDSGTTLTITPQNGFSGTVSFSCPAAIAGVSCSFNPTTVSGASGSTTVTISTPASLPPGSMSVTVNAASGNLSRRAAVNLAVSATDQSFTLTATAKTLAVTAGGTATTTITVNPVNGFNTALTFTCTDPASESQCTMNPATSTTQTSVTLSITTTAPIGRLHPPLDRGTGIFYASLLPGVFGLMLSGSARRGSVRTLRWVSLAVIVMVSTLGLASCGNSSTAKDPGTPKQAYPITVSATTGGANPITGSVQITLNVQ